MTSNSLSRVIPAGSWLCLVRCSPARPHVHSTSVRSGRDLISADAVKLLTAIRATVDGHFQDGSVIGLANQWERDRLLGRDANLSPRERRRPGADRGGRLQLRDHLGANLTHNSVKSMIRCGYNKIGVATRAQAVAWGVEHGFPTTPRRV